MPVSVPLTGRPFWKLTGSGNDFVFFDNRDRTCNDLTSAAVIGALCDRRRGVGADGMVLLDADPVYAFGMRYYNRDGSLAEMCGNAALCSASLATALRVVDAPEFSFQTTSGPVTARTRDGLPEIDMVAITHLATAFDTPLLAGERRIGYARVGVPHLVVLCDNVAHVDVATRGSALRHLPQLHDGANANFVSRDPSTGEWRMRTFERGVEEETLACGTGTVATVGLLTAWGTVAGDTTLLTQSGCRVTARSGNADSPPVLRGEGRIVFAGTLHDLFSTDPA